MVKYGDVRVLISYSDESSDEHFSLVESDDDSIHNEISVLSIRSVKKARGEHISV